MKVVRPEPHKSAEIHVVGDDPHPDSARSGLSNRSRVRLERDRARGYSINVKQVILAFAVEFVIIGLILTNQSAVAAELSNANWVAFIKATSLPIALSMAELARVPLAIAVRTQPSWNIKILASVGVLAAVVVTAVNLSVIGWNTYDPRLSDANEASNALQKLRAERQSISEQLASLIHDIDQKISKRDSIGERLKALQSQITGVSTTKGNACHTITTADGQQRTDCSPTNVANAAILKTLQAQITSVTKELAEADSGVQQANSDRIQYEPILRDVDDRISKAEAAYRSSINHSQLHSYAAMLFGKPPSELSDGEVKTLERYLIWVPSIAAALSSTLIAMTAVRRNRPEPEDAIIPDDAMTTLFGPLVEAIHVEARDAVGAAINERGSFGSSPKTGKT